MNFPTPPDTGNNQQPVNTQTGPPAPESVLVESLSPEAEEKVVALTKEIQSTLITTSGGVKCRLTLPTAEGDLRLMTFAMERLLASNFHIPLSRTEKGRLKMGVPVLFTCPTGENLPERIIKIDLNGAPRSIEITGHEPEHGKDSWTELSFDWQKRSCTMLEDGSIDWKNINSIPSVKEDQLLVTFHDRTDGIPGVDCYGKLIRQDPGRRHPIRWSKKNVRVEENSEQKIFRLFSCCSGAVSFKFTIRDAPNTLETLDISQSLTVKGDINYDYGDIKSAASLKISGSLKGNFSLQSDGFVHVMGSIEGKAIEARNIKAALITNGCNVFARDEIETGNINNAFASAENITIHQTASGAELTARNKVIFCPNSSFLGIRIHSKVIELHSVKFSGINEFYLGEALFKKAHLAQSAIAESSGGLEAAAAAGKNAATAMLTLIVQLEKYTKNDTPDSAIRKMLQALKLALISSFRSISRIDDKVTSLCYELQAAIGAAKYNESVMRKVDHIVSQIKSYNEIQSSLAELHAGIETQKRELAIQVKEIKENLFINLESTAMKGGNAELKISCGDAYKIIDQSNFGTGNMRIQFVLPDNADSFEDGELMIYANKPGEEGG